MTRRKMTDKRVAELKKTYRARIESMKPYPASHADLTGLALIERIEEGGTTEGVKLIAAERRRQIEKLGFGNIRDDRYCFGELAGAACSYAETACRQAAEAPVVRDVDSLRPTQMWRWASEWWRPSTDPVRNLAKAGALIAAEIDRLLRERESDV